MYYEHTLLYIRCASVNKGAFLAVYSVDMSWNLKFHSLRLRYKEPDVPFGEFFISAEGRTRLWLARHTLGGTWWSPTPFPSPMFCFVSDAGMAHNSAPESQTLSVFTPDHESRMNIYIETSQGLGILKCE